MLRSVRSSTVCTSRRRWPHRSDVGTEDLLPTTVPVTFVKALSGAGRCGQTGFCRCRYFVEQAYMYYVATLREQLEQLAQERTSEGLPRVSKAVVNDFLEKIEAIASKLAAPLTTPDTQVSQEPLEETAINESPSKTGENHILPTPRLRRRFVPASNSEDRIHDTAEADSSAPVKLGAAAQAHIEKHRKLQEDLTDEMVGLARQLKESSLMMSNSLQNTEKILDSTEQAVEHSLASTGRANVRAMKIYSESSKTSCFTWLAIFAMTCIFIMVVLLIRVT